MEIYSEKLQNNPTYISEKSNLIKRKYMVKYNIVMDGGESMKLRFRILLSCIVCVLLALLIQTFLFKETSSEMIYNLSREESENSLKNMQEEIYHFTGNMEKKMIKVYGEQDLISALKDENYTTERLREDFYRKAYDVGAGSFETSDKVMALYLYTADHEIISTYRKAITPKHNYPVDIYEDAETYNAEKVREYVESDETAMLISGYYNTYREKDIIRFVLKLYNNSNRDRKIGYVVCDADSKVFTDILEKYCTENTMYIWLQSDSDRPIVSRGSLSEVDDGIYRVISEQIQAGNQASIESKSTQELFQVEELKEKENQANLQLVQAQYKALQAQINPHFLYNTLDTMSSIAEVRECPEVSLLSQSLSNIFRYSLNMKDPFSTVAKEIVHFEVAAGESAQDLNPAVGGECPESWAAQQAGRKACEDRGESAGRSVGDLCGGQRRGHGRGKDE